MPTSAGLGEVLISYETTTSDPTNLDQEVGSDYCFTGLKVTIVPDTEEAPHRPTSTQLIPILHTTINNAVDPTNNGPALVRNQYARLPEITHGQLEGEAEVTKLNVLQNITLDAADAKDLLIEKQLMVGTSRNEEDEDETIILKVTLDCDDSGNPQNPYIEINKAPITTNNAHVTINTFKDAEGNIINEDDIILSVNGGAEVGNLTIARNTATSTLNVAAGAFEVGSGGETTIKNNLTVQNGDKEKFKVDISSGEVTITGTLDVTDNSIIDGTLRAKNGLSVGTDTANNKFSVNADGDTTIAGTLEVNDATTIKQNLIVKDGDVEKLKVDSATGNTTIAGTLSVGPSATPYLNITVSEGTGGSDQTLTKINTDGFEAKSITGTSITATGDLSAGNISSTTSGQGAKETSIVGNLTVKNSSNQPRFSVIDTKTTIATDTTEITGDAAVTGTLSVTGALTITDDTKSTTSDSGALKVTGGVGIGGALNVKEGLSASSLVINSDDFSVANDQTNIATSTTTITGTTTINSTLKVDADATVEGTITATNGLHINDTNKFSVTTDEIWELTADSVRPNTLYVPEEGKGHTSFSLKPGSKITINGKKVPTKSFYFDNTEYKLTPTVAAADLMNLIYPVGSIYMTMTSGDQGNPNKLFGGT